MIENQNGKIKMENDNKQIQSSNYSKVCQIKSKIQMTKTI